MPCTNQNFRFGRSYLCNSSPSTLLALSFADDRLRQTQTINPLFATREADDLACEAPGDSADDLAQKKIDYAIFIDSDSDEAHALYGALKERVPKESQGLWTHISTANLIPLFIFEVKLDGQDEAQFQLMTAARAFLKYLQSLLGSSASKSKMEFGRKTSLLKRLPPVIGWVVHRHEWKAYVSYSIGGSEWVSFSTEITMIVERSTNTVARYGFRCLTLMGTQAQGDNLSASFA